MLRRTGKYKLLDPAPLVFIKSVMDLMPQVTRWIMMLAARIMMLAARIMMLAARIRMLAARIMMLAARIMMLAVWMMSPRSSC